MEIRKFKARISELESFRYGRREEIPNWQVVEDLTKGDKYPEERVRAEEKDFQPGQRWEGRDKYLWLSTSLTVPQLAGEEKFVLLFDFGRTGGGHNSGFESLLFINNEPYQGVDSNHREVFIGSELYGQTLELSLKLWSGLEGGGPKIIQEHRFNYADSAILDEEVDDFYYTAEMIVKTIEILAENSEERIILERLLRAALKEIDWSQPGSPAFLNSVYQSNKILQKALDQLPKDSQVTVTAIGHTHIDVAWLWRLKHTREKAARSFSTVLRLMEQYPDYVFLQTQPQLYAYIKKDYPEIYQKIKARIAEGRWEVEGGMWLEADCNIPSGESFVRQFLHGSQFIKEEFGLTTEYLWLPDVFGYSWALPQILKKSGIKTFMTTKISWNQFNRMPHDTFIWRGIDGSEILTHFITTPEITDEIDSAWRYTYNGLMEPKTVKGIYDTYRDKALNNNLLLSYGYGDGGGGVNRDMLERRRRLNKIPGLPKVKNGRAGDYFAELHQTVAETKEYVHQWDGELYLEYHRGTYTSQAYVKKTNRFLELTYRELEILTSLLVPQDQQAGLREKLRAGWEIILRNQFHDIIPGSSIEEVYQDNKVEYGQALDLANDIKGEIQALAFKAEKFTWTVYNSASWSRTDLIELDVEGEGIFTDQAGEVFKSVKTTTGYQVEVSEIPALSQREVIFVPKQVVAAKENPPTIDLEKGIAETANYLLHWNQAGQLTRIFDKTAQREVLTANGRGNYFKVYEDKPLDYDAWDIDFFYQEKSYELAAAQIELGEANQFYQSVIFNYTFGQSKLRQELRLYSDQRPLEFITTVDWQERQQLLKTHFDINIRGTEATYDIQFGNVKRPTHWNTSWDMARFESVAHQWVDFSERGYGVALLNNSKYGHSVKDQRMTISLLKGGIYPDPKADMGQHQFTYSLFPHQGDFITGGVIEAAWELNQELTVFAGRGKKLTEFSLVSQDYVIIDALKPSQDGTGLVLRVHDQTGSTRQVSLVPNFEFKTWSECDLLERTDEFELQNESAIAFTLGPYEIKTFIFKS